MRLQSKEENLDLFDDCGAELLIRFAPFNNFDIDAIERFVKKSFSRSVKSIYCDRLIELFESRVLSPWCHECLYEYLLHLKYNDIPVDKVAHLFNLLDIQRNRKNELADILGDRCIDLAKRIRIDEVA